MVTNISPSRFPAINRHHGVGEVPGWVEMIPTSLPELPKYCRTPAASATTVKQNQTRHRRRTQANLTVLVDPWKGLYYFCAPNVWFGTIRVLSVCEAVEAMTAMKAMRKWKVWRASPCRSWACDMRGPGHRPVMRRTVCSEVFDLCFRAGECRYKSFCKAGTVTNPFARQETMHPEPLSHPCFSSSWLDTYRKIRKLKK